MYEQPNIPTEHLRACLQEQYALSAASLEFLPLGLDNRAGVFRIVSEQGLAYLLKAKAGTFYEASCLVPRYLGDQGIEAVVAPLPTQSNALWARLGEWTLIVYPFIEGETTWAGMTDAQWQAVGTAFKQIHQVRLPAEGFPSLRRETFDPAGYRRSIRMLEARHVYAEGGSQVEQALRASWLAHRPAIHRAMASLERLALVLQKRAGAQVICHADLHPANIIRRPPNYVFVIDWDDVMLAPRERDFIFVGEPPAADGSTPSATAPFFQGYGQVEVDWVALTYYLWERLVQDLICEGEAVFLRDDLGEVTKTAGVRLFDAILSGEGNEYDRALAAAAHLPADLNVDDKELPYEH